MQRWTIGLFLAASLLAATATATAQETNRVAQLGDNLLLSSRADAITLDGRLDEAAWNNTDTVQVGEPPYRTTIRALHDPRFLYLGIACQVPSRDKIVAVQEEAGLIYRDDSVELFLDPTHDGQRALQICVNAVGKVLVIDGRTKEESGRGERLDAKAGWDPAAEAYTLEIAIDRQAVGATGHPTRALGLSFLRNFNVSAGGRRQWHTLWRHNDPDQWGHVFLMDDSSFAALGQEFTQRIQSIRQSAATAELQSQAKALAEKLPDLKPRDKPALAAFERDLLLAEDRATRDHWKAKFQELF